MKPKEKKQQYWKKNEQICWLNLVTSNVICHTIQPGKPDGRYIFIGNGHSMDVDEETGKVTRIEPLAKKPLINGRFENDTILGFYYTFNCKGLDVASQELAEYINSWFDAKHEIILIGHSKSGLCVYNMAKYLKKDLNVKIVTVSAPFDGTPIASSQMFKELDKDYAPILNLVHRCVFCGHNVDADIVPGSKFLKNLQSEEEVCDDFLHVNYASIIECKESQENFQAWFCRFLNKHFFNVALSLTSDGIVTFGSQLRDCNSENFIQDILCCTHTDSLIFAIADVDKRFPQEFWRLF